jgi:Na+/proline symporter
MTVAFFLLYFVVVFAIGIWSMKLTRDESDYWIAGGKLGWLLGGATIAATHVSASSFIGTIGVIYTAGWSFAWIVLSIPLAYWFMAAVLARVSRGREAHGQRLSRVPLRGLALRRLSAVVILVAIVVYVQAQIVASGLVGNIVFGISREWAMVAYRRAPRLYRDGRALRRGLH